MRATGPVDWSPWQSLPLRPVPGARALAETLDGGQAFGWRRDSQGVWQGRWEGHCARLRLDDRGELRWAAPSGREAATRDALWRYLDADRDAGALADALPWRSDPHLARCLAAFPGLRILRQPFGETLLAFLCSATKRIVQIKQMLALLADRHGGRLPSWSELAKVPEANLRACRLGFRARHVRGTARFLADHPGWLEETEALPYPAARARLCALPGVGEKIADCVLLFGAGRLEAFPVDVWVLRAMAGRYGLDGWRPAQVAQFGRIHFGPLAGLAQQYLFAWERAAGKEY